MAALLSIVVGTIQHVRNLRTVSGQIGRNAVLARKGGSNIIQPFGKHLNGHSAR
jgi:hypothetical protein